MSDKKKDNNISTTEDREIEWTNRVDNTRERERERERETLIAVPLGGSYFTQRRIT